MAGRDRQLGRRRPITFDLRARPELRDDDPAGSGPPPHSLRRDRPANTYLPNSNSNRMIDTGKITCNQEFLLGTELLYIRGPLSLQGEYGWNFLNNAQIQVRTPKPITDYMFNGGYVQVAYTLTGENRAYDKKYRHPVPLLLRRPGTLRERLPRPRCGRQPLLRPRRRGSCLSLHVYRP